MAKYQSMTYTQLAERAGVSRRTLYNWLHAYGHYNKLQALGVTSHAKALPVFILGIFEGFVHTMGTFIFRLRKPSPGWYTAVIMCAYSIWALVVINRHIDYEGIQWLWASLYYVGMFALLEAWFQHLIGSSLPSFARKMRAFVFGKKNV